MYNCLGYSVYVSNFDKIKEQLPSLYKEGSTVFTSFHVSEEYDSNYVENAEKMCSFLSDIGYKIVADVSKRTLEIFKLDNLIDFANKMKINILRIDYGYSEEEITELAKQMPICVNASTLTSESACRIAKDAIELYAMHNFYPRPETGLDREQFRMRNQMLQNLGIKTYAFIPGDLEKRGPIGQGLTTLEEHRNAAPYSAYIDLVHNYSMDMVFVGDGILSQYQADLIEGFHKDNIISLPVTFCNESKDLYNQIYTVRVDSPKWLMRLQESREYACFGQKIMPYNCSPRKSGSITIDNIHYQRYSGEIQIIREPLAADERVNVIGMIPAEYQLLLFNISNGDKIRFINDK